MQSQSAAEGLSFKHLYLKDVRIKGRKWGQHGAEVTGNSGTSFDGALKSNFPLIDGRKKNDSQRSFWEAEVVGEVLREPRKKRMYLRVDAVI